MNRIPALAAALAATMIAGTAQAGTENRWAASIAQDQAAMKPADRTISYGQDPLQKLDFWQAKGGKSPDGKDAPLIIFVHGGGWQRGDKSNATGHWKVEHYPAAGYAFASVNYRLVPRATVEQQAQDVADALKALIDRSDKLGIDRSRIVLMGHSAGAHLVALVGTDERYLKKAGLSFADVAGVIPIDGAAYDVPAQMADAGRFMLPTYRQAFGTDAARQRLLSPTLQAMPPDAGHFLLLHVQRRDGIMQAQALAEALREAGTSVEVESFPGRGLRGHREINQRLGDPDYPATRVVDAWLKGLFGN